MQYYARRNIAETGKRTAVNLILEDPAALWESRGPEYKERPVDTAGAVAEVVALKTNSDVLRAMAVGWRPRTSQRFVELEWTATIMGGIRALRAAGVWPWLLIETDQFPELYFTKAVQRESVLRQVTELVVQAAGKLGDSAPDRPFIASEYIRKKVIDNDLQTAAWALRGMILTQESMGNQQARAAVEGGVGTTLATTASIVGPIFPIGTIVAAIIGPIATVVSIHGAAVGVEAQRSKAQTTAFQHMYVRGMEERVSSHQMKVVRQELETAQGTVIAVQVQQEKDAEQLAESIGVAIKVGSGVLVVGGFGLGIVWIYRRYRKKRRRA